MSFPLAVLSRIALALIVSSSVCGTGLAQDLTPSELFERTSPSVVIVEAVGPTEAKSAQGSGVSIERGLVVTNCHVLKTDAAIRIRKGSSTLPASIQARSEKEDLCILSVAGLNLPSVKIRSSESLKVGERVFAIGAPRGLELSLSDGLLSSIRRSKTGSLIQTTAPISPGSSGGGLFDSSGQLIGITTMSFKESQQLNFAIPAERVLLLRAGKEAGDTAVLQVGDVERARVQLAEFDKRMINSDPHYLSRRDELDKIVYRIRQTLPPAQWLGATEKAYESISARQPGAGTYERRVELARVELRKYDAFMLENDPAYESKRAALSEIVYEIRESLPPEDWLEATKNAYLELARGINEQQAWKKASSSRWVRIFQNEEHSIDIDSRLEPIKDGGVTAWTKWKYSEPTKIGTDNGVKTTLNHWHFSCASRKSALLSAIAYDEVGRVLREVEIEQPSFDPVIPDSLGELEWQKACDLP